MALLFVAIPLLQLIPLPAILWTALPGRETIEHALRLQGETNAFLPLTLSPDGTLSSLLGMVPALAMLSVATRLDQSERRLLILGMVGIAAASALLGLLQATTRSLYFYQLTSFGNSVGFFANANHQATLLILTLPLIAASVPISETGVKWWKRGDALSLYLYAAVLLLAICAVTTQSLAAIGLVVLAIGGVVAILLTGKRRMTAVQSIPMGAAAAASLIIMTVGIYAAHRLSSQAGSIAPPGSRLDFFQNTWEAIIYYNWAGSGLGSFIDVYPMFQKSNELSRTFVNHTHNDFLEFIMETGMLGLALVLTMVIWLVGRVRAAAMLAGGEAQIMRGSLAALLIILLHSLVDYPLRTGAIAAISGMLIALICAPPVRAHDIP